MKSFLFVFWLAGGSDGWSDLDKDEEKKITLKCVLFYRFYVLFFYNEEIFFTGGSGLDDLHEAAW